MPFRKSASKSATKRNFHDFRHGNTFRKTARKYGAKRARRQMVAAVLSNRRKAQRSKKRGHGR